ncbi:hypothetical protein I4U23_005300 [Adineta vaga]|nr:hypothetical protein I4U23_005300 [Adineta vaga]
MRTYKSSTIYCFGFISLFTYFLSALFFYRAWDEHIKSQEYTIYNCQVNSHELRKHRNYFTGIWSVTVTDANKPKKTTIEQTLTTLFESTARKEMEKYQKNQIYKCYGLPPNRSRKSNDVWEWIKPNTKQAIKYLFIGLFLFLFSTIILTKMPCIRTKCKENSTNNNDEDIQTPL